MYAATSPDFCASATMWSASVVLPEDSGPKISMTRPRGMPPTPMLASNESEVVEMAGMSITSLSPRRMIEPLPNFFSMFASAASTALPRSAPCLSAMFATTSFSSPFLTLLNLCLNSEDPESLPQTAREWNSVSHLQQYFFHPGGDDAGGPS